MASTLTPYLLQLKAQLLEQGDPDYAEKQAAYMKNHFDFYGLNAPTWLKIAKDFFKTEGIFSGEELKEFARLCFAEDRREVHYVALQMIEKNIKKQNKQFIEFLEELILTQSWWDSVDWIAKLVMLHFQRFPEQVKPVTGRWIEADNFWLQRVAITFQRYKKYPTDWELLQQYILRRADSKEFFVQKAAGWALREHSKIAPYAVMEFIEKYEDKLSKLTAKEGLKWVMK